MGDVLASELLADFGQDGIGGGQLRLSLRDAACQNAVALAAPATSLGHTKRARPFMLFLCVESDDPDVETEREVLRTSVVALDLRSGQFEVIER